MENTLRGTTKKNTARRFGPQANSRHVKDSTSTVTGELDHDVVVSTDWARRSEKNSLLENTTKEERKSPGGHPNRRSPQKIWKSAILENTTKRKKTLQEGTETRVSSYGTQVRALIQTTWRVEADW
jgi:hypothetical protein